jgi:SAM-dependent methyltransferase
MPSDTGYSAHPELPELYDQIPLYNSRRDIDFYVGLCREAGEALELGCGTGRILIPAAQAGCVITGLDQSAPMLARCRAKFDALPRDARDRITLVEADMTGFRLPRTFKLAIAPFRPIQHLTAISEQQSFLRCVRDHLVPGGTLVFDVFKPNLSMLASAINPEEIEDTPEFALPDGRRLRRTYRIVQQRYADQCTDCELIYYLDGRPIVHSFALRYFFRYELEHLMALAGFEVIALYGGVDRSPFTDASPDMIFTGRRSL